MVLQRVLLSHPRPVVPFSAYKHPAFLAVVECNARCNFPSLGNKVHREIRKRRIDLEKGCGIGTMIACIGGEKLPSPKVRQADDKIHNEKGD